MGVSPDLALNLGSMRRSPYDLPIRIFVIGLALSLVVHLALFFIATRLPRWSNVSAPIQRQDVIEVRLPVVDTLQQTAKAPPRDARFAAPRNLEADEDTSPERAPLSVPQIGGSASQAKPQAQPLEEGVGVTKETFRLGDLEMAEIQRQTFNPNSPGVTSQGFLERLKRGQEFKVNARELDYAGFIERMKRKLIQHWRPLQTVKAKMYANQEVRVEIGVVLNPQGEIVELRTLNSSLFADFDREATRALREAGPFPNPPKVLIQDDGLIYVPWGFVLYMQGWGGNTRVE